MKLKSDGRVELELDEEAIRRAAGDDAYKFEMLKQVTKMATLVEVSMDDHRTMLQILVDNKVTLARIAVATGTILSILTGVTVMV